MFNTKKSCVKINHIKESIHEIGYFCVHIQNNFCMKAN